MWIKICGITSLEDAKLAVAAGADAVGFVFAESPRRIGVEDVREIATRLPQSIEKIGVFVDSTPEEILSAIQTAALTGVQLHGADNAEMAKEIRQRASQAALPLHIVRVLHYEGDAQSFEGALRATLPDGLAETVLVDTRVAGKPGGTGVPFDWAAARGSFLAQASHLRLVVAGGLNPRNVGEAIRALQPWGVDVSSGVESSPGKKYPEDMIDFIREARNAAVELDKENSSVNGRRNSNGC